MKPVIAEQVTFLEDAINAGADARIESVDLGSVGAAADGDIHNLTFNIPNVVDTDPLDGFYNPRVWVENWPHLVTGMALGSKLSTTALVDGTAWDAATVFDIPYCPQDLENMDKATYFTPNELKYLALRLENTDALYDTAQQNRQDPILVYEWERENSTGTLATDMPVPNSDHLWTFSQVDIFVHFTVAGTCYRYLLGWCADEDFSFDPTQETVEFMKGKPTGRAVTFMSSTGGVIEGTISTCDPWFMDNMFHITGAASDGKIRWTEQNRQRPVQINYFELEWFLNSGQKVNVIVPRGQLYPNGAMTPGAGDIQRQGFTINPLVDVGRNKIWDMTITENTIQQLRCPITFAATA